MYRTLALRYAAAPGFPPKIRFLHIHCPYIQPWKMWLNLTLWCLVVTKRSHILKQTCSFQPQVCLSVCDLLGIKGLIYLIY